MRYDISPIQKYVDDNGFLKVTGNAAVVGVLVYPTASEHVPADTLFNQDSMESLRGVPVTVLHPDIPVTPENYQQFAVGTVLSVNRVDDALQVELSIADADAIKSIQQGAIELSCGYNVDVEGTSGTFNFIEFDSTQRSRRYNHIALVPKARAGATCKLQLDIGQPNMQNVILPNNTVISIEESQAVVLQASLKQIVSNTVTADALNLDAVDALQAKLDQSNALVTKLEASAKDRLDSADVLGLFATVDDCRRLDAKFEPLNTEGNLKTSIKMRTDALSASGVTLQGGESDAYLNARFDIAVEALVDDQVATSLANLRNDAELPAIAESPRAKFMRQQMESANAN